MKKGFTAGMIMAMVLIIIGTVHGQEGNMVAEGKTVKIHYTLTVNGEIVDSSLDKAPLEYVQGKKMIIPKLEEQLIGMTAGEKKKVFVAAEDAYGKKDPRAIIEVPKGDFTAAAEPKVGMIIQVPTQSGDPLVGTVVAIKEETLILDFNHPLAGQALVFDIEIVEVK